MLDLLSSLVLALQWPSASQPNLEVGAVPGLPFGDPSGFHGGALPRAAVDGSVWVARYSDAVGGRDYRLQRISAGGVPGFGPQGILVGSIFGPTTGLERGYDLVVASDGSAWFRNGWCPPSSRPDRARAPKTASRSARRASSS